MKHLKYILIVCIAAFFCSCDFLDVESKELTPENVNTEADMESLLLGVYSPLMQERFYGNDYILGLAGGDDLTFYQRSNPLNSIMCANANSGNPQIMTFWEVLYAGIGRANHLLEILEKSTDFDPKFVENIKSEARFLRAFYYFHLVQGWGDVPLRLEVPKKVVGLAKARTPKDEIYDFIAKEIEESIPGLKPVGKLKSTGLISQTAAQGILARIYLFRAGEHYRDGKSAGAKEKEYFAAARDWALKVKDTNLHDLVPEYRRIFIDYSQDKYNSTGIIESMWEVEEYGNRSTSVQSSGRVGNVYGFGVTQDYTGVDEFKNGKGMVNPGYGYNFAYASLKMYEMYENAGDTVRGDWNIAPYMYKLAAAKPKGVEGREYYFGKKPSWLTSVDGFPCTERDKKFSDANQTRCVAKYRREYEEVLPKHKNNTPINFPVLRYSDVLLMLAEAENEVNNGPTPLAYECINLVRNRAKLAKLPVGLSQSDFRDKIKDERAMELCYESLRRWDLIRWGDFYNAMIGMDQYIKKSGWSTNMQYAAQYFQVTPAYVYFPIPDREMQTNSAIKVQNPGW